MSYFLFIALLLNILPGPAMVFVSQQTIVNGLKVGFIAIIGVEIATLFYVIASAMGITIFLAHSTIFLVIARYLSAVLLIYLGAMGLRNRKQSLVSKPRDITQQNDSLACILVGMLINLVNPKILTFFLIILPQLVEPSHTYFNTRVLIMGCIFALFGAMINLLLSLLVNASSQLLKNQQLAMFRHLIKSGLYFLLMIFGCVMLMHAFMHSC